MRYVCDADRATKADRLRRQREQRQREMRRLEEKAGPDLLEALKKIRKIEEGCLERGIGYTGDIHIIVENAIAKVYE